MTEEKIVRAIRISKEMDSHIKKYVDGFSAWVENKYRNEFMQIEDIIRTIERHKKSIVMLEKEVKEYYDVSKKIDYEVQILKLFVIKYFPICRKNSP